jgi:hypothetical protein
MAVKLNKRAFEYAKGRYKFPYGDFEAVHRCAVLAAGVRK